MKHFVKYFVVTLTLLFCTYAYSEQKVVVLDMKIPYEDVDANVHPRKTEISLLERKKINSILIKIIRDIILSYIFVIIFKIVYKHKNIKLY